MTPGLLKLNAFGAPGVPTLNVPATAPLVAAEFSAMVRPTLLQVTSVVTVVVPLMAGRGLLVALDVDVTVMPFVPVRVMLPVNWWMTGTTITPSDPRKSIVPG